MNILKAFKRFFANLVRQRKMNNMRKRRESVVSVYKKTTNFITANTQNILKIMPNRKYRLLTKMLEEYEGNIEQKIDKTTVTSEEEDDFGERDLDYYLGVRKKEKYWRDPAGKEQIRKDFLLYHCGITEEDYEKNYKKLVPKTFYTIQPRRKQVPFKIHRKNKSQKGSLKDDSWREKRLFRLFAYRRDSEKSTSDSYSECDSSGERKDSDSDGKACSADDESNSNLEDDEGVRIKEVSEGRPCDNCPELCPGFIPHAWREHNNLKATQPRQEVTVAGAYNEAKIWPLSFDTPSYTDVSPAIETRSSIMCLSLKQFEVMDVYRKIRNDQPERERKIQKFPSRERNYAVRRKNNNNNFRPHINCQSCARVAERENSQNG